MPSAGDYRFYQGHYSDKTTDVAILAATDYSTGDGTAIISAKSANHQLFIQKITISITTYSAKTWTFNDSAGTPVPVAHISIPAAAVALPSESGDITFDFGPKGFALTLGKNLLLDMSAAGAAGIIHIEAYEKLGAVISYLAANQ